jgi:excisionase family DNA binding protein
MDDQRDERKHPDASDEASRVPRLARSPEEAASSLGVSRDYFDEHVRPEIRIVRRGRRILVPVAELQRWLERSASRALID